MFNRSRLAALAATALTATALIASTADGKTKVGGAPAPRTDSGVSDASITHTSNGLQIAAGNNYDKVLGEGAITYRLKLLPAGNGTFSVTVPKVVLYTASGSITGTASAKVAVNGTAETITNGKLNLTKGAGSLKGHQFSGTFTGTGDLAKNLITFKYKGILTS
jgi:hypothetical protein